MARGKRGAQTARRHGRDLRAQVTLAAAMAATLTAQVPASAQNNPFGAIVDRVRDQLGANRSPARPGNNGNQSALVPGIGAVLGFGACRLASQSGNQGRRSSRGNIDLCLVAAAATAVVTSALSAEIMKGVKENDREKILTGAAQAIDAGQPVLLDLPDSKVQFAIAPTGRKVDKPAEVSFAVDSRQMDTAVPPLRIFGQPYVAVMPPPSPPPSGKRRAQVPGQSANAAIPIYSRPDEGAPHPASLAGSETVHVIGQVIGQPWLLVSRWVAAGDSSTPMAIGYVREAQLQPSSAAGAPPANPGPAPATMQLVKMTATLQCEESDFTKVDARQRETKDTSSVCRLPQGSKTMVA